MPTFFRLAGILLVLGLVLVGIVFMTQTPQEASEPVEPNVEATPGEMADELREGDAIDEAMTEDNTESLSEEADNEAMEDPAIDEDQGAELEEGEIIEDDSGSLGTESEEER